MYKNRKTVKRRIKTAYSMYTDKAAVGDRRTDECETCMFRIKTDVRF